MGKTAQDIVTEIEDHAKQNCTGDKYHNYYVGITKDVHQRLFIDHKVNKQKDCYIAREALNIEHSRAAEKLLLDKGMQGGDGGGDDTSVYVYCYLITGYTEE